MTFLHRHINVDLSLFLAADHSVKYKLDVNDGEDVSAVASRALEFAAKVFKQGLHLIDLPTNPLPGDEPMVFLEIEYYEMRDGTNVESSSFTITETESIETGKSGEAVDNAVSNAFKLFTRRAAQFIQEEV